MEETGQPAEYVSAPCLMGLYIHRLLTEAYQLQNSQTNVHVLEELNGQEICKSFQLGVVNILYGIFNPFSERISRTIIVTIISIKVR